MILELLDSYENELKENLMTKKSLLEDIEVKIHETEKMIQLIKEENQGFFTDFTPRPIAEKNTEKLDELNQLLSDLLESKSKEEKEFSFIDNRIHEVRQARRELETKSSLPESESNPSNVSRETLCSGSVDLDKLHLVLSFLPQDPIRAKIELESLLR